jgi:prepilin-type N-terminal cleavage/methylation domain-containing protein
MSIRNQAGFTLPELLVVIFLTSLFTGLLLFFMISFWRYGLLLEADLDTLTSRLNAGDYLRENLNPSSGLINQNSLEDSNANKSDTNYAPVRYWEPIHAIPGTISVGSSGTYTPVVYFKRASVTTAGTVAMNGTQPFEDEYVIYLDGTTKTLKSRTLANPAVANNRLKTSCPAASATVSCPADRTISGDVSSVQMRYFSKTGNLINYTSSYDSVTNMFTGPDFAVVEVVEFTINLSKKPLFQKTNATVNNTVVRVALRS